MVKTFAEHSEQTRVENCTLVFKNWSLLLWNLKYILNKIEPLFVSSKFPYMTARDQWQILQYCEASWPFSPCFLLTLRNPLLFGVFGIHYNTIIAIPNAPKPNSRKWTSCFSQEKAQKWCQLSKRKELSIKEA